MNFLFFYYIISSGLRRKRRKKELAVLINNQPAPAQNKYGHGEEQQGDELQLTRIDTTVNSYKPIQFKGCTTDYYFPCIPTHNTRFVIILLLLSIILTAFCYYTPITNNVANNKHSSYHRLPAGTSVPTQTSCMLYVLQWDGEHTQQRRENRARSLFYYYF